MTDIVNSYRYFIKINDIDKTRKLRLIARSFTMKFIYKIEAILNETVETYLST